MLERRHANSFDWGTLIAALALIAVGLIMVASIDVQPRSASLAQKQSLALGLGLCLFFLLVAVDYHTLAAFALPLYAGGMVLLVAVLVIGRSIAGTHSWIELGPFRLQPSEPMKPLTALMLATVLGSGEGRSAGFSFEGGGGSTFTTW